MSQQIMSYSGSALNTRSNDFIRRFIEHVTSRNALGVAVRGDSGVAAY